MKRKLYNTSQNLKTQKSDEQNNLYNVMRSNKEHKHCAIYIYIYIHNDEGGDDGGRSQRLTPNGAIRIRPMVELKEGGARELSGARLTEVETRVVETQVEPMS